MKKRSKALTTIIAIVSAAVLLISGTFAWTSFSEAANNFRGDGEDNGGTLHDDFCEPKKDVYIENWGDSTIYVRIRLSEYMEMGENAGRYLGTNLSRQQDASNHAVPNVTGTLIYDQTTWLTHIPHPDDVTKCDSDHFHDYWRWSMGGFKYYMPADPAHREETGFVAQDPQVYNSASPGVSRTLDATVVTMASWKSMGRPVGNFWVVDVDGWAYWAAPLDAHTATGLLLNKVSLVTKPTDTYYYGINVIAQMATKDGMKDGVDWNYNDFGKAENGGWTQDGHDLLDQITATENGSGGNGGNGGGYNPTGNTIITANVPVIGDKIFVKPGETATLTANESGDPVDWTAPAGNGVTFTPDEPNTAEVSFDGSVAAGTKYAVSAADQANPTDKDTKYLVVIPPDAAGVVEGGNGKPYIDLGDNTFITVNDDGSLGGMICGGLDEIPGTSDDRSDIVIGSDGGKYLGPNDDGSYQKPGNDGLLGTADDEKVWKLDENQQIGPGNETDQKPSVATQVQLSVSGIYFQIGDTLYIKQGASINVQASTTADSVNWNYTNVSGVNVNLNGKTAHADVYSTANPGARLTFTASAGAGNSASVTMVVIPSGAANVVVGGDGKTYVDFGDNTYREILSGGGLGDWICGGEDLTPGTLDDLTNVVVSDDGNTRYLGPNGDGSYWAYGPDGKLGTSDDTKVWKKDPNGGMNNGNLTTTQPATDDTPTGVDGRTLPAAKAGDTSDWIEIATNGGYSLLVRADFIQIRSGDTRPDWNTAYFGSTTVYKDSIVRDDINKWFTGNSSAATVLSPTANLRNYTVKNNSLTTATGVGSTTAGLTNSFSKPIAEADRTGLDVAFALSYSEAANFCSTTHEVRTANPEMQASPQLAINNYNKLVKHTGIGIWLRTPGDITGEAGNILNGRAFQLQASKGTDMSHIYPAVWVDSSIFNN
ncbi:MAG: hypothetical protein FWF44_03815 [Defluviitaleaceae bacterium]|nr:hypothetical protein [Defluviitaleaceae bacterium]